MSNLRAVEISSIVPVPRGHRVLIQYLTVKVLLFDTTAIVVWDITDDIWYGSNADVLNFARNAQANTGMRRVESVLGVVRTSLCTSSFSDHSRARTDLFVEVEEVLLGHVDPLAHVGGAGRAMSALHDEIRASKEGIEQRWPSGERHLILWGQPFTVTLHRNPPGPHPRPTTDVHLRLMQRRDGQAHIVSITMALSTSPKIQKLPALSEFNSKIQGGDAQWLMDTVGYYAKHHGVDIAL